jgi:hypothetical protein
MSHIQLEVSVSVDGVRSPSPIYLVLPEAELLGWRHEIESRQAAFKLEGLREEYRRIADRFDGRQKQLEAENKRLRARARRRHWWQYEDVGDPARP